MLELASPRRTVLCVLVCALAIWACEAGAQAFTKIADLQTPIPGGTGAFTNLTQPQVSLGNVVFAGAGLNNQRGIYRFDATSGTVSPIVDGRAPLPTGGQLTYLEGLGWSVYGPDVSFLSYGATGIDGIVLYTTRGGLHEVPGVNAFQLFSSPPQAPTSMASRYITFGWSWQSRFGPPLKTYGAVYDTGEKFVRNFGWTVERFLARDSGGPVLTRLTNAGIPAYNYLASAAGTFEFSDRLGLGNTYRPNFFLPGEPTTSYTFLGTNPTFSADDRASVALVAYSSPDADINHRTQWGVYTKAGTGGVLTTVANNQTPVPNRQGGATFASFDAVAIDGPNIVFIGSSAAGPAGMFMWSNGSLGEVLSVGDSLDGKTISSLSFSDDRPLSGNDLVFTAGFTDGSKGLFLTQVPEPAALGCVAAAVLILSRRRG